MLQLGNQTQGCIYTRLVLLTLSLHFLSLTRRFEVRSACRATGYERIKNKKLTSKEPWPILKKNRMDPDE